MKAAGVYCMSRQVLVVIALILIALAALSVLLGILSGQLGFAIVLIFPVIYGSGYYALITAAFIFGSFVALFLSFSYTLEERAVGSAAYRSAAPDEGKGSQHEALWPTGEEGKKTSRFGGVIFIGPVPIIFGSNPGIVKYMFAAAAIMVVLIIVLFLAHFL